MRRPAVLDALEQRTREIGFGMASEPLVGALLRTLARSKPGGRMLELGTGTGVGSAWLLDGMDAAAKLISVDTEAAGQAVAREFLDGDKRLDLVTGDALEFLGRQARESFDLVFADAMPGKYEGLEEALAVVARGGFYVIDDLRPQANWPEGHAAKVPVLIERLAADERFEIAPMAWSSGVVVAVRR